jgi:hypothetical protein
MTGVANLVTNTPCHVVYLVMNKLCTTANLIINTTHTPIFGHFSQKVHRLSSAVARIRKNTKLSSSIQHIGETPNWLLPLLDEGQKLCRKNI